MKKEELDKNKLNDEDIAETGHDESSDYEFIRESIRKRPVNRKKVVKKMLLTAGSAVLFATIACLTFLLLEPVLDRMINKKSGDETDLNKVTLNETPEDETWDSSDIDVAIDDTPYEETPIEDLNLNDDGSVSSNGVITENVSISLTLDDYQLIHRKMYILSQQVRKSLVDVTFISSDMDVLNDTYLSTNRTMGLIVAESGSDLYVLVSDSNAGKPESITATFSDGATVDCEIISRDKDTGLMILRLSVDSIPAEAANSYKVATIGSSSNKTLLGNAIIAVGDPLSVGESICYGAVTSNTLYAGYTDSSYQIITTDIVGNQNASGVLVNTRGQVIGFISQKCQVEGMDNMVCAYGISSITDLVEKLSNDSDITYIGLHITNVTPDAKATLGIPGNAYITKVENNSPASAIGLMPGDIITGYDGEYVGSAEEYMRKVYATTPGAEVKIKFQRLNGDKYEELTETIVTTTR